MGYYGTHVLPKLLDVVGGNKSLVPLRQRACEGLAGEVVEIGFGSGLNIPYYPEAVTGVPSCTPTIVARSSRGCTYTIARAWMSQLARSVAARVEPVSS